MDEAVNAEMDGILEAYGRSVQVRRPRCQFMRKIAGGGGATAADEYGYADSVCCPSVYPFPSVALPRRKLRNPLVPATPRHQSAVIRPALQQAATSGFRCRYRPPTSQPLQSSSRQNRNCRYRQLAYTCIVFVSLTQSQTGYEPEQGAIMTTYTHAKPAGTPTWSDLLTPDIDAARGVLPCASSVGTTTSAAPNMAAIPPLAWARG